MAGEAKAQLKKATEAAAAEAKDGISQHQAVKVGPYQAPGRLGDPAMQLKDEPRVDARVLKTVTPLGMGNFTPPASLAKINENSSLDEISEIIAEFEDGITTIYGGKAISLEAPGDENIKVDRTEESIKGGDGQDMTVYIYRPTGQGSEKLPGVVYSHGGGMVINSTQNPVHNHWCRQLASNGVVVMMPDFRNAYTKKGYNHFPKGLNDCAASVRWFHENRDRLKVSNIVLTGESGGGNLAAATTLKAKREGWVKEISGVYPIVPYISNLYGASEERQLKELPSLVENHGYFLNCNVNAFMGYFYTPNDKDSVDPLAWPYHATEQDMKGLPPHTVVMDELDPLRDEGLSYARRLAKAGVSVKTSMNVGTLHGSSLIFRNAMPELHQGAARDIAGFARSL